MILVYTTIASSVGIAGNVRAGSLAIAEIAGLLASCSLLVWLSITMIRLGRVSGDTFPAQYKKARWIGLIAGAVFFPILGLPAFLSIRRLTQYHELIHRELP